MRLKLLYRGPLDSCNYACSYCPFATRPSTPDLLRQDQAALERFLAWLAEQANQGHRFELLFTPYGEALIHPWYQEAIIELSHRDSIQKVAIQTNLSCDTAWLRACSKASAALWVTYHPDSVALPLMVEKCRQLSGMGIRYSVGAVGIKEHFGKLAALRRALPDDRYFWVNAFKRQADYYTEADIAYLSSLDPLFTYNLHQYSSIGRVCAAGLSLLAIEGDGCARRCHFVPAVRGNIYQDSLESLLSSDPCPAPSCHCHIGYVHLQELGLDQVFGSGILERIPELWPRRPA